MAAAAAAAVAPAMEGGHPTANVATTSSTKLLDEDGADACVHRIHAALAPRVAVLASSDVDDALTPNNLKSFAELVKPFERTIENVSVRTSQLETRQCYTFPLSFEPLDEFAPSSASSSSSDTNVFTPADLLQAQKPEEVGQEKEDRSPKKRKSTYARPEVLLDAISARVSSKSKALWESRPESATKGEQNTQKTAYHRRKSSSYPREAGILLTEGEEIDVARYRQDSIDTLTPWFTNTRDMILQARRVSDHETFGHPLAIVIVVSASSPDPMNALANLFEASQPHTCSAFTKRPYVDPLVFRYYVVLHDVSKSGADLTESVALLENVKKTYGLHCCLLPINSATVEGSTNTNGQSSTHSDSTSNIWRRALYAQRQGAGSAPESAVGSPVQRRRQTSLDSWRHEDESDDKTFASLIDEDDVRRIRAFVRDFAAQSLIPFMERCVSLWTEQLAASRKGLTGRLLGAGRKFFGGASRGTGQGQSPASFAQLGYYPHTTLEAQTRRLADFAFATRDYKLAASMYDLGRRDYANDKAHKYVAGANEMFGLSHLMIMLGATSAPIDVDSYLAAAGAHYLLAPRQKGSSLQLDGLRATLLYYEAYRALSFYRPAPQALVRTASEGSGEEENDLEVVAAMLLEQAALADVRQSGKPALRKCALHLVMAAHRYRSCGQKHLSLRCFEASAFFYRMLRRASAIPALPANDAEAEGGGDENDDEEDREPLADYIPMRDGERLQEWDLINDHMEQEMAQQAFNDGRIAQATVHYATILQRQANKGESLHSATQHEEYLRGFLTCCKYLDRDVKDVLTANGMSTSLSIVDVNNTFVEVNASTQRDDAPWRKLEESVLGEAVSSAYKMRNTAAVGESFSVHVGLRNPFNSALSLSDLALEFVDGDSGATVEESSIEAHKIDALTLQPLEERILNIVLSSHAPRTLRCNAVLYHLSGEVPLRELIVKRGKRLNETKEQRTSVVSVYAPNESISLVVHESKAIVEASLIDPPTRVGLGEELRVHLKLVNVGKAAVSNVRAHVNRPDTLLDVREGFSPPQVDVSNSLIVDGTIALPLPNNAETLNPGDSATWSLMMRGSALGLLSIRSLIVFTSAKTGETLTSQLQHDLFVEPVIELAVQAMPSRLGDIGYQLRLDAISLLDESLDDWRIEIDKLTLVAPAWKVDVNQKGEGKIDNFSNIKRHERRSAQVVIGQVKNEEEHSSRPITDLQYPVERLRTLLTGRGLDSESPLPPKTLLQVSEVNVQGASNDQQPFVSPFLLLARREFRLALLSSEFPALLVSPGTNGGGTGSSNAVRRQQQQLEQIFTLYEPRDVDIVADWRMTKDSLPKEQERRGQAFVFGLTLGPLHDYLAPLFTSLSDGTDAMAAAATRSMYAQTEREKATIWSNLAQSRLHVDEDPVLLDFDTSNVVSSSLQGGRHSMVVPLVLRNLSSLDTYKVILQLDNTSPPSGAAALASTAATTTTSTTTVFASYVDRLTIRTTMPPLSCTTVHAKASIPKPGRVYVAPVLVRSQKVVQLQGQKVEFQRWEYCTQSVDV